MSNGAPKVLLRQIDPRTLSLPCFHLPNDSVNVAAASNR